MLKGILEGFVSEIISHGETYGYQIVRELNGLGLDDVVDGTVYTILLRMEKNGLVDVRKMSSDLGPPRKYYKLNESGIRNLEMFWNKWEFIGDKANKLRGGKNAY
jgi:DNA-binding PadR family transcriptional regulator